MSLSTAKRLRRSSIQSQHLARKWFWRYSNAEEEIFELERSLDRRWKKILKPSFIKHKELNPEHLEAFGEGGKLLAKQKNKRRKCKDQATLAFRHALGLLNRIREERGKSEIKRNFDDLFAAVVIRKDYILKK